MRKPTKPQFIVELHSCGSVSVCRLNGAVVSAKSAAGSHLLDCSRGQQDATEACRYVLRTYAPQFRIVKLIDGKYENVVASLDDKRQACRQVYHDSDKSFEDEQDCDLYLIWEASASFREETEEKSREKRRTWSSRYSG